ncbi:PQQ-binding-like beta-propeller repeat protein [Actinoplanes sp. CA-054009]
MKSRYLSIILAAALSGISTPAAATTPDDWGQAAAHATGDHYNPGETRLTPATAGKLKPRWSVPLENATCADPAVPLVGAGRLVTAAAYRISGHDATTGALIWRTPATGKKTRISLAAIVGTRLVAQYRDCRSGKTFLTVHDVTTGRVLYRQRIAETMYNTLADKGVLVGGVWDEAISKYALRAYRIADGARLWAREGSIAGENVAAGGRILVVGDDATTAVDVTTGRTLWTAGAGCFTPIGASTDGAAFYMRCDPDGRLRRVSATTGEVLKTFPSHGSTFGFATDGERVYLHTFANEMIAIDAADGHRVWTSTFADAAPISFAVGGGVVYGKRDGDYPLAAFEARTGRLIELDARTSAVQDAPMVANGRLYGRTRTAVTTYAP